MSVTRSSARVRQQKDKDSPCQSSSSQLSGWGRSRWWRTTVVSVSKEDESLRSCCSHPVLHLDWRAHATDGFPESTPDKVLLLSDIVSLHWRQIKGVHSKIVITLKVSLLFTFKTTCKDYFPKSRWILIFGCWDARLQTSACIKVLKIATWRYAKYCRLSALPLAEMCSCTMLTSVLPPSFCARADVCKEVCRASFETSQRLFICLEEVLVSWSLKSTPSVRLTSVAEVMCKSLWTQNVESCYRLQMSLDLYIPGGCSKLSAGWTPFPCMPDCVHCETLITEHIKRCGNDTYTTTAVTVNHR